MASKKDTKTKILDAAEELFSTNGIGATSLRTIIAKADVNIAAIHYHFGSKKEVVTAVYARRITPLNQQRLERLEALNTRAAEKAPTVAEIVDAFLAPILNCSFSSKKERERAIGLFSHLHTEPQEVAHVLDLFKDVFELFMMALSKILPHLSKADLLWRFMFMIGVMSISMSNDHLVHRKLRENGGEINYQELLQRAVHFITAGFEAPTLDY
jgi:AcrR family transcriptional regulator